LQARNGGDAGDQFMQEAPQSWPGAPTSSTVSRETSSPGCSPAQSWNCI
jgi:hypothetical protein